MHQLLQDGFLFLMVSLHSQLSCWMGAESRVKNCYSSWCSLQHLNQVCCSRLILWSSGWNRIILTFCGSLERILAGESPPCARNYSSETKNQRGLKTNLEKKKTMIVSQLQLPALKDTFQVLVDYCTSNRKTKGMNEHVYVCISWEVHFLDKCICFS